MEKPGYFHKFKKEITFFSILFVTALGVMIGSGLAYRVGAVPGGRYEKLGILAKVLYLIETNYVRDVDEKDLITGAINGMLATLDPHSNYLPPSTYKEIKVDTQGKFQGIGIEITIKQGSGLTVVSPIEDTPAHHAGLLAGDQILAIDGESTKEMPLPDAVNKMRGKRGTKVRLLIMRKGYKEPKEFVIARDTIQIKSVKFRELEPGYGYVRVTSFQERTNYDLNKAIDAIESKNGPLKGLVLDLRNNPGGLLDQAIKVADTFLPEGKIVITKGRNKKQIKVEDAQLRGTRENFPMIVLVNGGSASASEIVAGALQDNNRAVVLGTQTFGKGSVQTVIDLDDGSGLKLTIARYFTPSGRDIQEKGIVPDINIDTQPVSDDKTTKAKKSRMLREADLKGHLRNLDSQGKDEPEADEPAEEEEPEPKSKSPKGDSENSVDEDFQLKSALDFLKTWEIFKHHSVNAGKKPVAEVTEN